MYEGKHPQVIYVDANNEVIGRADHRMLEHYSYKARVNLPASFDVRGKSITMLRAVEALPLWTLKEATLPIEQFANYAKLGTRRYFRFIVDDYTRDALQRHFRVHIEVTEKGILVSRRSV